MDPIKSKRRWLKFNVRSLLALTLVVAVGIGYLRSPTVVYDRSLKGLTYDPFGGTSHPDLSKPQWTWTKRVTGKLVHGGAHIQYMDRNHDRQLDIRGESRRLRTVFGDPIFEKVQSIDNDFDGFFDSEVHTYNGKNGEVTERKWTKRIHIPVPKTTP